MAAEQEHASLREFPVDLPVYQGPFRALAELILEKKMDVCDIPIAGVVEAFLAKADEAEGWTLEEATWFLATCAVLLELKVRRLLPRPERPLDEEDMIGASPDLAYARSRELAAFRRVARDLARRMEESARHVPRSAAPPEEFAHLYPDVLEHVTPQDMAEAAAALFRPPPMVDLSHVTPIRLTVAEAVETVVGKLSGSSRSMFRELVADCREPIEVVVRFLAVLELHKEGRLVLSQATTFGEIEVSWEG
ncbi:MAG TPA: ScpA family protein [Actinomycetota bacterium]